MTVADHGHLIHVLALVPGDLKHPLVAGIPRQPRQEIDHQAADKLQRIFAHRRSDIATGLLGIENPLDHGIVEVGLVLEMPVDGATGHARLGRDLGQGRAGDPCR